LAQPFQAPEKRNGVRISNHFSLPLAALADKR
jgi:hypothetical protein